MTMDQGNALFELIGMLMTIPSIRKAWLLKHVSGVHWITPSFFAVWAGWSLFWYPHLNMYWSFGGAVLMFASNMAWLLMVVLYTSEKSPAAAK